MKLNFKKLGEGPALIILHGLFGSLDNWMSLAKYWSKNYTVYLVDQRNHGQSFHADEHSYQAMANDIADFVITENISKPILLGHSMGGKTAMEFAVSNPDKLGKLIVVDIAPVKYQVHHYKIIEGLESVDLNNISSRKEADEALSKHIKEFGVRQFLLKNLFWVEKEKLGWRFNLPVLKKEILPISEYSIQEGVFDKETLFVKGENSNYILEEYMNVIKEKFPQSELQVIKGAGHWVHAEKREEFVAAIDKFLA